MKRRQRRLKIPPAEPSRPTQIGDANVMEMRSMMEETLNKNNEKLNRNIESLKEESHKNIESLKENFKGELNKNIESLKKILES